MPKFSKTKIEYEVFDDNKKSESKSPKIGDGELYQQALGYLVRNKKISINLISKLFNVGFKRAKGVIEQFEKNNIIETHASRGARVIKIPKEKMGLVQKVDGDKIQSFHYVNHILKMPGNISVIEEDDL